MLEHQHVQFEQIVQVPLVRSAGCTIAQPPAAHAQLGLQREEAAELEPAIVANLKEFGYGW